MNSIILDIKKFLGLVEEYTVFDSDIIMHANSAFMTLSQLGVGDVDYFMIEDMTKTWSDFVSDVHIQSFVKQYVYLKVRILFDPPANTHVLESINKTIDELEWRMMKELEVVRKI